MDIGAGGLIAFGGDYLSLAQENIEFEDGGITVKSIFTDSK